MNTHVVTKPLSTRDGILPVGAEVNASDWRLTRKLEEQRYIKPIQQDQREKRFDKKDKSSSN
jgi:hypothetical protein